MGQGFGLAALWVEVWICGSADGLGGAHEFACLICLGCCGSADGLLRQCWICLGWGLAAGFVWVGIWLGFALSCVFGCGGCGGGCWLLAEGC